MNRKSTPQEKRYDSGHLDRSGFIHRLVVRIFRRHVNGVAKYALGQAFARSMIDSFTYHEICGIVDVVLWPERYRECDCTIQKNNIVMGDCASRDIIK